MCTTKASRPSAVDVEAFTLNEDVVRADMEAMAKWNQLSDVLSSSRATKDYNKIISETERGLELLGQLGPLNSPIQCETHLCLEASQAHYNLENFEAALTSANRAKKSLLENKEMVDASKLAEVNEFIGYILLKQGKGPEAEKQFQEVLKWITVDSRTAMPMQAVAAVEMKRTTLMGVGLSQARCAEMEEATGGDPRPGYGKALDVLIEALNLHIDENDFQSVKTTLSGVLKCFIGVGDVPQAVSTSQKYISWCDRHNDADGAAQGKAWLDDVCKKNSIDNPLADQNKPESA